jgi:hypothetical protein
VTVRTFKEREILVSPWDGCVFSVETRERNGFRLKIYELISTGERMYFLYGSDGTALINGLRVL